MAVWDLYSKREKVLLKAGQPNIFQFDQFPNPFRVQVVHIMIDMLGRWNCPNDFIGDMTNSIRHNWAVIYNAIIRERGVFFLTSLDENPQDQIFNHFIKCSTLEALDIIELSFRFAKLVKDEDSYNWSRMQVIDPDVAIRELNARFREHGIGYEFAEFQILRVDSSFIHAEAVRPAFHLLNEQGAGFSGPLEEFLEAHGHYTKSEYKQAIVAACKAFESTLKAVCKERRWEFDAQSDTASKLIKIVLDNELAPQYLQSYFNSLGALLGSGVPTVRNRTSGHGQSAIPIEIPGHFAAFALHLTASSIVFLIEAHRAKP